MVDKTTGNDKAVEKPTTATEQHQAAGDALRAASGIADPKKSESATATAVKPTDNATVKDAGDNIGVKGADKPLENVDLTKVTSAKDFDDKVQQAMKASKDGTPVHFDVDNNTKMTDATGAQIKVDQTEMLYDSMAKADPSRAFRFNKYADEVKAPVIDANKDVHASTRESPIILGKDVTMPDGTVIPKDSKLSVGTVYDGQTIHQIDPDAKIWATKPDGSMMQVAGPGESRPLTKDDIGFVKDPATGEDKIVDGHKVPAEGAAAPAGSHLTMRTLEGNDPVTGKPLVDPDGKPLVDGNTIKASAFGSSYEEGKKPGYFAPKAKVVDHYKLPENVSVAANTEYGPQHASGADKDYYMKGGFADAKAATAKNYAGFTDPKSAAEIIQARKDVGLTGVMPAEIGLQTHNEVSGHKFNSEEQRERFNSLVDQIAAQNKNPAEQAKVIEAATKSAVSTQEDIAERRGYDQFTKDQLTTTEVNLAVKAAEAGVKAEAPAKVAAAPERAPEEKAAAPHEKAPAPHAATEKGDAVFKPKGFQSSEGNGGDRAKVAENLYKAMETPVGERTPAQREQVEQFKEKHGLQTEEEVKGVRERLAGRIAEGATVVAALALVVGAAGEASAATRKNSDKVTFGDK